MKNTFNNLKDLFSYFQDEKFCREYLAAKRWGDTPACPYCGNCEKIYTIENGNRFKCKACQKKFSVTVGTIFEDSKLPLKVWFQAMFLISTSKKGVSSLQLASQLGITQKSAWHVLHRIREMIKEKGQIFFGGKVEVDEAFIGGEEKNKHWDKKVVNLPISKLTVSEKRKLNIEGAYNCSKTVVFGIVERQGNVFAKSVPSAKAKHIVPIIEKYIEKGSTMLTDDWYGYGRLSKLGYIHRSVNHSEKEYVRGDVHTNTIENFWSIFKRGIYGIYHSVSAKHIDKYLEEFAGRYNSRKISNTERFDLFLENSEGNLSYNKLTQKNIA